MPTSFWTLLFRIILQQPLSRVLLRTLFLVFPHFYSASSFWNSAHLRDCKLWDYYPVPRQVQPIRVFGKSLLLHHPNPERCFTKIQLEPLYVAPVWFWAKPPTWIYFFFLQKMSLIRTLFPDQQPCEGQTVNILFVFLFILPERVAAADGIPDLPAVGRTLCVLRMSSFLRRWLTLWKVWHLQTSVPPEGGVNGGHKYHCSAVGMSLSRWRSNGLMTLRRQHWR